VAFEKSCNPTSVYREDPKGMELMRKYKEEEKVTIGGRNWKLIKGGGYYGSRYIQVHWYAREYSEDWQFWLNLKDIISPLGERPTKAELIVAIEEMVGANA